MENKKGRKEIIFYLWMIGLMLVLSITLIGKLPLSAVLPIFLMFSVFAYMGYISVDIFTYEGFKK